MTLPLAKKCKLMLESQHPDIRSTDCGHIPSCVQFFRSRKLNGWLVVVREAGNRLAARTLLAHALRKLKEGRESVMKREQASKLAAYTGAALALALFAAGCTGQDAAQKAQAAAQQAASSAQSAEGAANSAQQSAAAAQAAATRTEQAAADAKAAADRAEAIAMKTEGGGRHVMHHHIVHHVHHHVVHKSAPAAAAPSDSGAGAAPAAPAPSTP